MAKTPPIIVPILGDWADLSKKLGIAGMGIENFGAKVGKVGRTMSIGLTAPIAAIGFASARASVQMNEGMAKVGTLIPGQIDKLTKYKTQVQDLSIATGKGTDVMAEGLFQVISAFGDTSETMDRLRIASRASVAGSSDILESVNLASSVTKAYGDESAAASQKVFDLAFITNKLGVTTFPELAASLPKVTALSKQLNITQEEMFGVMATATGVTGNTSEVSTQFSAVLAGLIKPTAGMSLALKELGFSSGEALVKEKGLQGTMIALKGIADKYGVSLGKLFESKEALTIILALTGGQADNFTKKLEAMNHVAGATEEAFKEQTEGINKAGFAMQQATQRLTVMGQRIGDELLPVIADTLNYLQPFFEIITSMPKPVLRIILVVGGLVAVLGPLLILIGSLAGAIGAMNAVFGVGFVAALGPIGLVVAAIGLLAVNFALVYKNWEAFKYSFSSGGKFLKTLSFMFGGDGGMKKEMELASRGEGANFSGKVSDALKTSKGNSVHTENAEVLVKIESNTKGTSAEIVKGTNVTTELNRGSLMVGE